MILRADLHIHSCLSPCGSLDMSPSRIVKRAAESGLDVIALTDHNSALNCPALEEAAREFGRLHCLYGLEITSMEEVHALALFGTSSEAVEFGRRIYPYLPDVRFDPDIFGEQVYVDEEENVLGMVEKYLVNGLFVTIDRIESEVHAAGGLFIPAHVDKPVNSIISQLGFIPGTMKCDALEFSRHFHRNNQAVNFYNPQGRFAIVTGSDAHYPEDMGVVYTEIECDECDFNSIANAIRNKKTKIIHN